MNLQDRYHCCIEVICFWGLCVVDMYRETTARNTENWSTVEKLESERAKYFCSEPGVRLLTRWYKYFQWAISMKNI
jgi:hypothetical protein